MEVLKDLGALPFSENLCTSLSGSFLNIDFHKSSLEHYQQFGENAEERFLKGAKGEILARTVFFTKEFYQKDRGRVKILVVTDIKTVNSREALLGWSEKLLPEILKFKRETESDYALFFLSRRERGLFDFFMRPRKVREDQIRFSHLRSVNIEIVQGLRMFASKPLEHVHVRRAQANDLPKLERFIKAMSLDNPISRLLDEGSLKKEIKSWKNFDYENLALAFDFEDNIVGSLGAYDFSGQGDCQFKFDEVLEPTFVALQTFLKMGSWLTDLRPVLEKEKQSVKFFTHMYFSNHDIFYTMIHWWIKQTKLEKSLFLYPFYKGDLKGAPPESLFCSAFKGDVYLVQNDQDAPSELLKPALFSRTLDIDLPLLF